MKQSEHLNPSAETGTGCLVTSKYGRTPPNKHGSVVRQQHDSRVRLGTSEASCSLSPSQVAGQPSSDGVRQGRSDNLGYQYVMRHCIKGSCQVNGHTHCTERRFPLVKTRLDGRSSSGFLCGSLGEW